MKLWLRSQYYYLGDCLCNLCILFFSFSFVFTYRSSYLFPLTWVLISNFKNINFIFLWERAISRVIAVYACHCGFLGSLWAAESFAMAYSLIIMELVYWIISDMRGKAKKVLLGKKDKRYSIILWITVSFKSTLHKQLEIKTACHIDFLFSKYRHFTIKNCKKPAFCFKSAWST